MAQFPSILRDCFSDSDDDFEALANVVIEDEQLEHRRRTTRRGGSIPGHIIINRGRSEGHQRLYQDYFSENPVYPNHLFRRRFRLNRSLFCRIANEVERYNTYFVQRRDVVGVHGLSSLQKITAEFRMLAYGTSADSVDEYVRIGESTTIESLRRFVQSIVTVFGDEYLRAPNANDIARLVAVNEQRGFPGMLGSIDCMHWRWKNCPSAWKGMYTGHSRDPTIILEAVASQDLWIWHAFFGLPGSLNDINVLERSPVFATIADGSAPPINYWINGNEYTMGYYLADGIYPTWATFVKTISLPQGRKNQHFAVMQESTRKDVERAFGVLQARFAIVRGPACVWDKETLTNKMKACIIMHNMIIEDEGGAGDTDFDAADVDTPVSVTRDSTQELTEFIRNHLRIRDRATHSQLQADLVEHLWQQHGEE